MYNGKIETKRACRSRRYAAQFLRFQFWHVCSGQLRTHIRSYVMYLLDLPPELLIPVLDIATAVHPIPAHVLVLNKFIYSIAAPILYRHLYLPSISTIARFPTAIWGSETVGKPSTITVDLAGAEVGRGVFRDLLRLLSTTRFPRDAPNLTRLELEDLRLCLHSTNDGDTDDKSLRALEFVE